MKRKKNKRQKLMKIIIQNQAVHQDIQIQNQIKVNLMMKIVV